MLLFPSLIRGKLKFHDVFKPNIRSKKKDIDVKIGCPMSKLPTVKNTIT